MLPTGDPEISLRPLQHRESESLLLGCGDCPHVERCGGLQINAPVAHCQDLCNCENPDKCDTVCMSSPERFVRRVREVNGFGLNGVNLSASLPWPKVANYVPVVDRSMRALQASKLSIAALPMREACKLDAGTLVALSKEELAEKYGGAPEQGWILTGVDHDSKIEQIWGLGEQGRFALFDGFKQAGISCATTPNFSLMADVPRPDNLHSCKRIGIIWGEMNAAGIPTALHLNGRTRADFDFYASILNGSGGDSVAFEFATGSVSPDAADLFLKRLEYLTARVKRRLHIVVRGGVHLYPRLLGMFESVTQLDTGAHMKAKHRQVLERGTGPRGYRWRTQHRDSSIPVGELFLQTVEHCRWVDLRARQGYPTKSIAASGYQLIRPRLQLSANDETGQMCLFPEFGTVLATA